MTYNHTTYFKDHNQLLNQWREEVNISRKDQLEAEIEQLSIDHLKYSVMRSEDLV